MLILSGVYLSAIELRKHYKPLHHTLHHNMCVDTQQESEQCHNATGENGPYTSLPLFPTRLFTPHLPVPLSLDSILGPLEVALDPSEFYTSRRLGVVSRHPCSSLESLLPHTSLPLLPA